MADQAKTEPQLSSDDKPRPSNDRAVNFKAALDSAKNNPFFVVTLLGALVVTLVDQASKTWIVKELRLPELRHVDLGPVFDFTYVRNYGASFGMLTGGLWARILLSVLALSIVLVLVYWLTSVKRRLTAAGVAFIIGGAVGNLIDRVLYGYVIDFIDFSHMHFPWVFNVADSAINVGVGLLLLDAFKNGEDDDHQNDRVNTKSPS